MIIDPRLALAQFLVQTTKLKSPWFCYLVKLEVGDERVGDATIRFSEVVPATLTKVLKLTTQVPGATMELVMPIPVFAPRKVSVTNRTLALRRWWCHCVGFR